MATTAPGSPYVESSDLVANYPAVSEALAERVDLVGVLPFADATARTTAIPSPVEGQMSSLSDEDAVYRYDGSAWVELGKNLVFDAATVAAQNSTTSTSYTALGGPAVTVVTGTKALVAVTAWQHNPTSSAYTYINHAVSGATTIAASDNNAGVMGGFSGAHITRTTTLHLVTGLTPGSNTFTMQYKTNTGTAYFQEREIFVQDMGS